MYMDSQQLMWNMVDRMLWNGHSLGNPILGSMESVVNLDQGAVAKHYEDFYRPNNMVICIAGDISEREATETVEATLSGRERGNIIPMDVNEPPPLRGKELFIEKDIHLTHLILGMFGAGLKSSDRHIFEIINILLGQGASSRLVNLLREKYNLAYQISSEMRAYEETGQFSVHVSIDSRNVQKVKELITEELDRLKTIQVEDRELVRAKACYKQALAIVLETNMGIVSMVGKEALLATIAPIERRISMIDSITGSDVKRVAKYLDTTNCVTLTMGPRVNSTILRKW